MSSALACFFVTCMLMASAVSVAIYPDNKIPAIIFCSLLGVIIASILYWCIRRCWMARIHCTAVPPTEAYQRIII
jgi:hypothetical protein